MNPLRRKVLFVCTGNTCRSPMAEHLLRKLVAEAELTNIEVQSAGVSPSLNLGLPAEAVAVLREENVRDVHHAPKGLDEKRVAWADFIFAMEPHHQDAVVKRFPDAKLRTHVLKIFAGTAMGQDGVADPYGGSEADYRAALADIKAALTVIVKNWK